MKCSPKLFHGGNAVAHVIVEYVNVSPSATGIETGSVATVHSFDCLQRALDYPARQPGQALAVWGAS